ncbi:MAG: ATPase, partial [Candidatus Methanoperedens sp.]
RLSPGVAMIVSTYIERPVLVDIRVRKSKHGGASVPVVKPPISTKINIEVPEGMDIAKEIIGEQKTIEELEKKPEKIPEEPKKETPKKKRQKDDISLIAKMFGSRKK